MEQSIKIAICDDNIQINKVTEKRLNKIFLDYEHQNFEIYIFTSGLKLVTSQSQFDLIILDVEMPELNGFDVAIELNKLDDKPLIIFFSGYDERVKEGYEYRPFNFLTKDVSDAEFGRVVKRAIDEIANAEVVEINFQRLKNYVKVKDISHVTSFASTSLLFVGKNELPDNNRLNYWIKILPNNLFFQISRDTLINLSKLERVEKNKVRLNNGHEFTIPRRRAKDFQVARFNYVGNKGRS